MMNQNLPYDIPVIANHACDWDGKYDPTFMGIDIKWALYVQCSLPSGYDESWTQIGKLTDNTYE